MNFGKFKTFISVVALACYPGYRGFAHDLQSPRHDHEQLGYRHLLGSIGRSASVTSLPDTGASAPTNQHATSHQIELRDAAVSAVAKQHATAQNAPYSQVQPVTRIGTLLSRWFFTPFTNLFSLVGSSTASPGNAALLASSFAPFKPKVRYHWDATTFYEESDNMPDGMPNKMAGITAWQQQIPLPTSYFASTTNPEKDAASLGYGQPNYWRIPLTPVPSASPIPIDSSHFLRGAVALASNGIAIFNPRNNTGIVSYEIGELDPYGGHCGMADDYHYHIVPTHLLKSFGGVLENDQPVAWALDGYPIYGFLEPDGSPRQPLDADGGHDIGNGWGYHYHAIGTTARDDAHPFGTPMSPYLMNAFHGSVVNYGNQVDGQAEVTAIRSNPSGGYEAKVVSGGSIVAFLNPVALKKEGGHWVQDLTGTPSADNYLMRVIVAGTLYDECWRINREAITKTLEITWRIPPNAPVTTVYNNNGSRLNAYPPAANSILKLPDTAQTADTTSTFGEDADYNINGQSFTDNGNGTITDNLTGLMWQKIDNGESTWETAVANSGSITTAGYTDWRLPTPAELMSIFSYNSNPALNSIYFPVSAAEYWWSSDVYGASTTNVWCANKGGGLGGKPKAETISAGGPFPYHARYVRGRPPSNLHTYINHGDGTVTDTDTGLMWTQVPGSARTWDAALSYAETLSKSGYSDWRLPNIKELQSLTDYALATGTTAAGIKPSINRTMFAATLTNCTLGSGSSIITCSDTSGLVIGMPLVDPGNAGGTYFSMTTPPLITAINSATSFTISSTASKTGSGLTLKALAPPTAYWSSTSLSGKPTEAWLLETGINTTVPAANGPTRNLQGIISYETKTASYPVFAVRTTTTATQISVSESGNTLSDGISTIAFDRAGVKSITVQNSGVTTLTLNSITIDGTNAAQFGVLSSPAAGTILTGGSSLSFDIQFLNPSAGTTYSGTLHIASSDPAPGAAVDIGLSGSVPVIASATTVPLVPSNADTPFVTAKITPPSDKTLRASNPVQLTYTVGSTTTSTVFSETMSSTAASPWTGTLADNLWDVVSTAGGTGNTNVQQASAANHTTGGGGTMGLLFTKGLSTASASQTQATIRNSINAAGIPGAAYPAYVEFYVKTVNPVTGYGWQFQLSPSGNAADFTTRLSETSSSTAHDFTLYHYDLPDTDRVSTLKMRFQFSGNGTGGGTASKVYIDDIIVKTTTGNPAVTVTMYDDGLHGDGAAGDGVYGAQIPTQPTASSVAYSITTTYSDNTSTVLDSAGNYTTTSPLSITTSSLQKALTSTGYNQTLAASGGTPPYAWRITSGSLPPGLSLSAAGVFTGTATTAGNYTFTASAADSGGHTESRSLTITSAVPPNVVIILTDDQGWGDIGYHTAPGQVPISTPNMDGIRTSGIRLEKFYATAVCSVTRAALLTGRNTIRTGVNNSRGLDLSEHIMPQSFKAAGYQTFICGKWHLGGILNNTNYTTVNGARIAIVQEGLQYAPYNRGWDYHKGTYTGSINYFTHISSEPELVNQLDWWENGQPVNEATDLQGNGGYSTDLLADKAVDLIQKRDPAKPFLLYLPFNAMHTQVSAPQSYLNKYAAISDPLRRTIAAAVECMDDGIGRVMRALDAEGVTNNTILLFMSDNGGDEQYGAINDPLRGTKGDGYDGGIHTPAAIRFPAGLAAGISSNQYVWVGDIFPTLCAATGVVPQNTKPFDGINLWPALQSINSSNPDGIARPVPLITATNPPVALDRFNDPASGTAKVFKIIYDKYSATLPQQLFNMTDDPTETTDLLKTAQAGSYTSIASTLQTNITDLTAAAEVYPPYVGTPLITQSVAKAGTISLYAPFTCYGRAPISAQWYKNGVAIGGTNAFTQATTDTGTAIVGIYTSTLTLSNLTLDDAGQYKIVVTNTAGSTTSDTGTLTVILSAPVLDALPTYSKGSTCALTWPAVTNATSYSVQIATDSTFSTVLSSKTIGTTSVDFTGLLDGVKYYYRATATDGVSTSEYSSVVSSMQDATNPAVVITSPVSAGTTTTPMITVQGTAADALSGIASVVVNGVPATSSDGFAHWSATIPLDVDLNTVTAVASDGAQSPPNQGSASITITLTPTAPVVSSLITGPTLPTYMDRVFATAKVRTGTTPLAKVELTYDASVPIVTKVFHEAFQPASTNNWNGSGAMNPWTTVGGASVRQAIGVANHTTPISLTNCQIVSGSFTVTCDTTANLWPGMYITGMGIQNSVTGGTLGNTRVTAILSQTSFVMSQAAIASGNGITVTACGVVLSNCKTTASSTTVTCDSTAGLVASMSLDGTGLANNAVVSSVTSGTSFTMNAAPTTASAPATITITANGSALEFNTGTANLSDTTVTTTNAINTSASAGYVEFHLQTRSLSATNNNTWMFQVYDGTNWNTRLSDSWTASTVTVNNCALNPTGSASGSSTVSCSSTAGLNTGRTVSGPTYFVSGTLTAGSAIMTCPNPTGLAVGMFLDSSKGMGTGARILAIDSTASPAQITMSANATVGTSTAIAATYFSSTTTVTAIDPGGSSFTISEPAYVKTTAAPISVSATTINHGFQLYHYDLQGSELGPNTKLRFQFSGCTATPPNSNPRVDIDDIVVMTSTTAPANTITMYDDGLHGDGAAGDFIYGAEIPVQSAGTTVKYKVTATDTAAHQTTWPTSGNNSYVVGSYLVDSSFENAEFLTIPTDNGVTVTLVPLSDQDAYIEYGTASGSYTASTPAALFPVSSGTMRIALSGLLPDTKYFYRVRHRTPGKASFDSRGERSFRTARPRGSNFVFTITADPHLDFATDPVLLSQAMANILADQPDFHIDLGDIFMTDKMADTVFGVPAEYGGGTPTQSRVNLRAKIFRNYFELACHSVPYFYTLGNHEAEYGYLFNAATDKRNNIPAWNLFARKAFYPAPTPNSFYTGNPTPMDYTGGTLGLLEDYYAWEWGDALFVVLDPFWNTVANPTQANDAWLWTLGKTQYDWLKATLENSSARFKFLFMHHLIGGTPTLADGVTVNVAARGGIEVADKYEWGGKNKDNTDGFAAHRPGWAMPIHQLLVATHVNAVFHGHDHLYAYQTLDGIVYLECPQPGTFNYTNLGSAPDGKYTEGVLIQNSGHIRVTITPNGATSDYVRAFRPQDINASQQNRAISHSFTMAPTFYPSFELLSVTPAGATLRWNAIPNKEYAIQWSPDLQTWSTIDKVSFPAVTTNATYTDTAHTNTVKGFYRISYSQ